MHFTNTANAFIVIGTINPQLKPRPNKLCKHPKRGALPKRKLEKTRENNAD